QTGSAVPVTSTTMPGRTAPAPSAAPCSSPVPTITRQLVGRPSASAASGRSGPTTSPAPRIPGSRSRSSPACAKRSSDQARRRPPIEPDDRGPERAKLIVHCDEAVDLGGEADHPDLAPDDAGLGPHRAYGRRQRPLPVSGILLGPAAGGVGHLAGRAGHGNVAS